MNVIGQKNKVIILLENRGQIIRNYQELLQEKAAVEQIEGEMMKAVDYSRPVVQNRNPGAYEDHLIDLIDKGRMSDLKRPRCESGLEDVRKLYAETKQLEHLIGNLPLAHRVVLRDAYIFRLTPREITAIYKSTFKRKRDVALDALVRALNTEDLNPISSNDAATYRDRERREID